MSTLPANLAAITTIVQDNMLLKEFQDVLFPNTLYRRDALQEEWESHTGDIKVIVRPSLLTPVEDPLTPGEDPQPEVRNYEQWTAEAEQLSKTVDTVLPLSRAALNSTVAEDTRAVGLNAAQSMNRRARDSLFRAYLSGNTVVVTGATSTSVSVAALNGFTITIVNGKEIPVSATNTLAATIGTQAVLIQGATPTDPAVPLGPGVLTLTASITFLAGDPVKANNAPAIIRPGGALTIDSLNASSVLTFGMIMEAVLNMADDNIPKHSDGMYHVHVSPKGVLNLRNDNEFQRSNEGNGMGLGTPYGELAFGKIGRCLFIENNESPGPRTVTRTVTGVRTNSVVSARLGAEVRNLSGVEVVRTIVTGGKSLYEYWVNENREYMSEAGVTGKIGAFKLDANGVEVDVEHIRFILRSPLDRVQQTIAQTWSWTGGYAVPTDLLAGKSSGRYKRAVVIETGGNG